MPPDLGWQPLLRLDGAALEAQCRKSLEALGGASGMLGAIFRGARCEIHNPALLKQLIVNLLDDVDWMSLPVDVKGTIYEELVARSAQESSRGAGQYFTPRPVVQAMCEVVQLTPQDRICDPAAGTGGFPLQRLSACAGSFRRRTGQGRAANLAGGPGGRHGAVAQVRH